MFKFSEKLGELSFEQKLLFLTTLIIPCLVFATILILIFEAVSSAVWEYFIPPPKTFIDFSFSHSQTHPFLFGYFLLSSISLAFTSGFILYKKHLLSIISLLIPLISINLRSFYIYFRDQETLIEPSFKTFFESVDLFDAIFFLIVSGLLIWQISILFRVSSQRKNPFSKH